MAGVLRKLRSRLLAWNWDAWNHPWRAILLTPVLVLLGVALSLLVNVTLVHDGIHLWFDGATVLVVTVTSVLGSLYLGYLVLALVD